MDTAFLTVKEMAEILRIGKNLAGLCRAEDSKMTEGKVDGAVERLLKAEKLLYIKGVEQLETHYSHEIEPGVA